MKRLAAFAWSVLAYNLAVVAWGAYVRATGSGAGCGSHWPTCQGDVIPRSPALATVIEYTHRLSSGLALLLTVALVVAAFRAAPRGHPARRGAVLSIAFMLAEAAVGAGLVLFGLVAGDTSLARGWAMSVHLVNTLLLLGSLSLTAYWASGGNEVSLRRQGAVLPIAVAAIASVLILGVSGAITALGDTLFPAASLAEGVRQDFSPTAHLFLRLRVLHPVIAVAAAALVGFAAWAAATLRPNRSTRALAYAIGGLFALQLGAGLANLVLLAPVWLQLVHLLLADLVWIALVLLAASALRPRTEPAEVPLAAQLHPQRG
jgi:heme A synthase